MGKTNKTSKAWVVIGVIVAVLGAGITVGVITGFFSFLFRSYLEAQPATQAGVIAGGASLLSAIIAAIVTMYTVRVTQSKAQENLKATLEAQRYDRYKEEKLEASSTLVSELMKLDDPTLILSPELYTDTSGYEKACKILPLLFPKEVIVEINKANETYWEIQKSISKHLSGREDLQFFTFEEKRKEFSKHIDDVIHAFRKDMGIE